MPYIYPPQGSIAPQYVSKKALKQPRTSMESEHAVERELDQQYGTNPAYWHGRAIDVEEIEVSYSGHERAPADEMSFVCVAPPFSYHLLCSPPYKPVFQNLQQDLLMRQRAVQMPFDDRVYPPTSSGPVDDWYHLPIEPTRDQKDDMAAYLPPRDGYESIGAVEPQYTKPYQYPAPAQTGYGFDPALHWSPSCAYPAAQPFAYRAPVLHPRHVQLAERPITPHDTYRYPEAHAEYTYIADPVDAPTKEVLNEAFAAWYVDHIIELLVKPGQYRPGVGGQSDDAWGPVGREKDSWQRIGRSQPDTPKPWGRMGMPSTPTLAARFDRNRRLEQEPRDPWNVIWSNRPARSVTLVAFVSDMLQRMSISPVAVVSAIWYLHGLGFHDGDGSKGSELRNFLRTQPWSDLEAVEKRIATLGLLLAGKWLDDNSFLSKSWAEVTSIPIKQIDRMERYALADLHFSLYVPVSAWSDHVNQLFTTLYHKPGMDELDAVVVSALDHMVTEARESELTDPLGLVSSSFDYDFDRRLSAQELPAAADQAIDRDWGTFARSFSIDPQHIPEFDADLEAERTVAQLVDDEDMDEDDDDEEFLDYDGAKRWLPSMSSLRRSASASSAQSVDAWRSTIPKPEPAVHLDSSPAPMYYDVYRRDPDYRDCHQLTPATAAKAYPTPPAEYVPEVYSTDVYLEPGISIVQPSELKQVQPAHRSQDVYSRLPSGRQYW